MTPALVLQGGVEGQNFLHLDNIAGGRASTTEKEMATWKTYTLR